MNHTPITNLAYKNPLVASILGSMFVTASNAYFRLPNELKLTDNDILEMLSDLNADGNLLNQVQYKLQEKLGISDAIDPPILDQPLKISNYLADSPLSLSVKTFVGEHNLYNAPNIEDVLQFLKNSGSDHESLKQDLNHYLFNHMVSNGLVEALKTHCEQNYFKQNGKTVSGETLFSTWDTELHTVSNDQIIFDDIEYRDFDALMAKMENKMFSDCHVEPAYIPLATMMKPDDFIHMYQPVTMAILNNMDERQSQNVWTLLSILDNDDDARMDDEFLLELLSIQPSKDDLNYSDMENLLKSEIASRLEILSRNIVYRYSESGDNQDTLFQMAENMNIVSVENKGFEVENEKGENIPFYDAGSFFYAINEYFERGLGKTLDVNELVDEEIVLHHFPSIPKDFEIIDGIAESAGIKPILDFINQYNPDADLGDLDLLSNGSQLSEMIKNKDIVNYNHAFLKQVFMSLETELRETTLLASYERNQNFHDKHGNLIDPVEAELLMDKAYEQWQPDIHIDNYTLSINGKDFQGEETKLLMGLEFLRNDLLRLSRNLAIQPERENTFSMKP